MTRWLVPPIRRCVQATSLFILVALPLLALYTHYKAAHAIDDLPQNDWRGVAVRGIDRLVGDNAQRKELVEETQGTIWSARICGMSLTDPLAGAEAILSSRTFYRPLLWSLLIPLILTILLGRVFCGWICPMNTLLEVVDKCRKVLRLAEIRERDVKFSLKNKYFVLVIALGFVAGTGVPFLAMVYPPAVLSREMHLFVFGGGVGIGVFLVLAIGAFELFVSRRWWCRIICPGGALYAILGRFRLVRVRRNGTKCIQCGDCIHACQFDLKPMQVAVTGMECTNCATCISVCQSGALRYGLVLPKPFTRNDQPADNEPLHNPQHTESSGATSTFKTTVGILLLMLCLPRAACAHHILGLPHYSYKDNYPQAPTLEYPATTGPYDVLMTSYPGQPVPGEPATIAFYIKNRNTGQPYAQPVSLRVLQTSTFGTNTVVYGPATHAPFDNEHKYTVTFPIDGEYIAELSMDVEGKREVIAFVLVSGNPTATVSVVIAVASGLAVFLVTVRAIKIKRDRRNKLMSEPAEPAQAEPMPRPV